ncbi:GGDEF domain-containing response regulator [Bacillus sp. Hm123]|uniref:GGDEF domain-containing response regulator n=1 Tax=Bacillus sp. Hm123 TaxID=3450745 RepID=UPI003F42EE88
MVIEKYQKMIYERMQEDFRTWEEREFITEKELYLFLHSLKGTAGTVGLTELSVISNEKIATLEEDGQQQWLTADWKNYLAPMIEGLYFYEKNAITAGELKNEYKDGIKSEKEFILVIDDDIVFITFIKDLLEKEGYSVLIAHNGQRGLELLYEVKPAMVFLDIKLPDTNGFTILEDILKKVKKEHIIITMMSADGSPKNRIRAYEMGALDFIAKPIDQGILISYVTNRINYKNELEQSIVMDELTKMFNRKYMNDRFQQLIQQFNREEEPFAVALLDLDFFKKVNDTYGHLVGDEVLQGFAALVKQEKREQDIACRYGGEEFALLMPNSTADDAYVLLERLRKSMAKKVFSANGVNFQVTFSAGVVEATRANLHPKKLLEEADQALYHAKQSGRNQTIIFGSHVEDVQQRMKITMIIVDDVFIVREMVSKHFSTWEPNDKYEIDVLEFSDGVSFLQANWYTPGGKYIVLLDGKMPDLDGFDVLKQLRERYPANNVLVSMLTGRSSEQDVIRALECGADDYIVKPFDIQEVSQRIVRLIKRVLI